MNITKDNIKEIYYLYLKLKPKNFKKKCIYVGNELMYSSSILFDNNKSQNLICNKNDESKYKKKLKINFMSLFTYL